MHFNNQTFNLLTITVQQLVGFWQNLATAAKSPQIPQKAKRNFIEAK